jgi:hypothetical protein
MRLVLSPNRWIEFEIGFVRQCHANMSEVGSKAGSVLAVPMFCYFNIAYWRLGIFVRFLYFFVLIPLRTRLPNA